MDIALFLQKTKALSLPDLSGNEIHLDTTGSSINIIAPETMMFTTKNMSFIVEENMNTNVVMNQSNSVGINKTKNIGQNEIQTIGLIKNLSVGLTL